MMLRVLALLVVFVVASTQGYAVSAPDECSIIALLIEGSTPEEIIRVMRWLHGAGPVKLGVVNTTGRIQRTKDGRPCETLLLDVRLNGERVFSVFADVQDARPWYRKLWPW